MDGQKQILVFVGGLVLVVVLGVGWGWVQAGELARLQRSNNQTRAEVEELAQLLATFETGSVDAAKHRQQQLEEVRALAAQRGELIAPLVALEDAFPTGTWLVRLSVDEDSIQLHGRTKESEGVSLLMEGLQDSPCFEDVALRSVEGKTSADRVQAFWLEARLADADCATGGPGPRDLFEPQDAEFQAIKVPKPPLARWEPREYELVQVIPGELGMLRDPEEGLHRVQVGSYVGNGRAKVTFITEDQLVLTEDVLLDEETGKTESRIVTLGLLR